MTNGKESLFNQKIKKDLIKIVVRISLNIILNSFHYKWINVKKNSKVAILEFLMFTLEIDNYHF